MRLFKIKGKDKTFQFNTFMLALKRFNFLKIYNFRLRVEFCLVSTAGGDYSKGDRVIIKSSLEPHAIITSSALLRLYHTFDPKNQPYLVELVPADDELIIYFNIL